MVVVAFVGTKAGTGKTAAAVLLAAEWHRRKKQVLLVDADPQECALHWAGLADGLGADRPAVTGLGRIEGEGDARALFSRYGLALIDCPTSEDVLRRVIRYAGVLLIPCAARPSDVEALHETVAMTREVHGPRRTFVLVSRRRLKGPVPEEILAGIRSAGMPILDTHLHQHVIFEHAIGSGSSAADFAPGTAAEAEIRALADELDVIIEGVVGGLDGISGASAAGSSR